MWYLSENYLCSVFFWSFHVSANFKKSFKKTLKKAQNILKQHIFHCFKYHFKEFKSTCLIVKFMKSSMKETGDLKIICSICSSKWDYLLRMSVHLLTFHVDLLGISILNSFSWNVITENTRKSVRLWLLTAANVCIPLEGWSWKTLRFMDCELPGLWNGSLLTGKCEGGGVAVVYVTGETKARISCLLLVPALQNCCQHDVQEKIVSVFILKNKAKWNKY